MKVSEASEGCSWQVKAPLRLWELLSWVEEVAEGQGLFVRFNPKCKMKSKGLLLIYLLHLHRPHSLGILLTVVSTSSQNHKPWLIIFSSPSLFAFPISTWICNIRMDLVFSGQTALRVNPEEGAHCENALSLSSWDRWPRGCGQVNQLHFCRQAEKDLGDNRSRGFLVHELWSSIFEKIKSGNQRWLPESRTWGRWLG